MSGQHHDWQAVPLQCEHMLKERVMEKDEPGTSAASIPSSHPQHEATPSTSTISRQRSQAAPDSPLSGKKRKLDHSQTHSEHVPPEPSGSTHALPQQAASSEPGRSAVGPTHDGPAPQSSSISMARAASSGSVLGENDMHRAEAGPTHAADVKAGEEEDIVWRSREQLAACLGCDLCSGVLNDPVTAPECMHSYCRDCIDKHVMFGGTRNLCPVCKQEGLETVLGTQPFQHGKLQFDPMLADLIKKLFPRAEVEKGIQERLDAEAKWRADHPVKKQKTAALPQKSKSAQQKPSAAASVPSPASARPVQTPITQPQRPLQPPTNVGDHKVTLFLQLAAQQQLPLPYLRVDPRLTCDILCTFVQRQLQLDACTYNVGLYCEGVLILPSEPVNSVVRQWLLQHNAREAVVINIQISAR